MGKKVEKKSGKGKVLKGANAFPKNVGLPGTPEDKLKERAEFIEMLDKAEVVQITDLQTGKVIQKEGEEPSVPADGELDKFEQAALQKPQLSTGKGKKVEPGPDLTTRNTGKEGKKKPESKKQFTRIMAFSEAFKKLNEKGFSRKELIQKTDDLYVKHGGPANLKESEWAVRHGMSTVQALGEGFAIPKINVKAE